MQQNTARRGKSKLQIASRLDPSLNDVIIQKYLSYLDCPRSLTVHLLYKYGEHDQLANLACHPDGFSNPYEFRSAYLATNFLKKSDFLKVLKDPNDAALEGFYESEKQCLATNRKWRSRDFSGPEWNAIHRVSMKISSIIGTKPNIDRWLDASSWGPGATLSVKRSDSSSFKKFRDERGITTDASVICEFLGKAFPFLAGKIFQFELGDRLSVVPKDARKGRVILVQPGWNLWLQKGAGKLIRSKLKSCGLDLDIEASLRNQSEAKASSKTGAFATIDMRAASDTIAIEPLREVLPPDWFQLLDLLRSKRSNDGSTIWNKFSSMGNGFTFELETLLFYAISLVSCEISGVRSEGVSTFGDDILIPTGAVESFHQLCKTFGFSINPEKSFSSGPFRESCGEHYYDGINCKPIYLKRRISVVTDIYRLHNQIRLQGHQLCNSLCCDLRGKDLCSFLRSKCPRQLQLSIPHGFGDVGFVSNFDEAQPVKARHQIQGFYFKALVDVAVSFDTEEPALLLVRLTEHSDLSRRQTVQIKTRTRRRIQRLLASEWYNLGPWL